MEHAMAWLKVLIGESRTDWWEEQGVTGCEV